MSFLHPEFLVWMGLPVGILFYFWITQKPLSGLVLSETILEKLRVRDDTMGLRGRNILFLVASLLMIFALSGPMIRFEKLPSVPSVWVVALDISAQSEHDFDEMKKRAIERVTQMNGRIEVLAFDEKLYRISPSTKDTQSIRSLITNLSYQSVHSEISDTEQIINRFKDVMIFSKGEIREIHLPLEEQWILYPFFYFPLGLAMILIALALSSMSKRESVTLAFVVLFCINPVRGEAGIMDFRILDGAYMAYKARDYYKSAELFREYQKLHDSPQVRYNLANAYYRAGEMERARFWYMRVYTNDMQLQKWTQHNLSLSAVKEGKKRLKKEIPSPISTSEHQNKKEAILIDNATPLFYY